MSLWSCDLIAFNEDGLCNGKIIDPNGNKVEIQSNKLIIDFLINQNDKTEKKPRNTYKTLLTNGRLKYENFDIEAIQGPQDSIFALVINNNTKPQKFFEKPQRFMAGIGCNGYEDCLSQLIEFLEINKNEWDNIDFIKKSEVINGEEFIKKIGLLCSHIRTSTKKEFLIDFKGNEDLLPKYVGLKEDTFKSFIEWFESLILIYPKHNISYWFQIIKNTKPLRISQSTLFSAFNPNDIFKLQATPIGQIENK